MTIPDRWRKLFKLLPGYCPVATAEPGEWFDSKSAEKVVEFFRQYVTHIEGEFAKKPFVLEPWQEAMIGCVFGWKRADGTRRYREVFQYVPRKNGKSTLCGGIINAIAFLDNEPGAQLYCAAADRAQASLVFNQTRGQISNRHELLAETTILAASKEIRYRAENVTFKALSSDADNKHGFNTHAVIVDELHAHPNRELLDVLLTSTGSRRQPLVWIITTADYDRPSVCNEKYEYATKVRDRIVNDSSFLPVIYEAGKEDDWTSPEVWAKANPNLGISIKREYLERECKKAKSTPGYENTFRRLHLNQRTEQDVRMIPLEQWDAGRLASIPELAGVRCFVGVDMGAVSDFAACALVFPLHDGQMFVKPYFWLPSKPRKRDDRMQAQIEAWAASGFIRLTEGNAVDYGTVIDDICKLRESFDIAEIAVDPMNARQAMQSFQELDFEVIEFPQRFSSMSAPTKHMMNLLANGKLLHDGNPVLRWMASNAAAELDGNDNIKISKKKSGEKIDGLVAAVMGIGRAMLASGGGRSIYEDRGVLTF